MFRRSVIALTGAFVLVGLLAAPAFAHVTIQPGTADQGGFTTQVIQVPNETSDANTTQIEVTIPNDNPIANVSVQPVPGWTINVEKSTLATPIKGDDGDVTEAVSKITWSGGTIAPGEFQQFPLSMGPMPDTSSLVLKAVQTYDNGDVVRWIELTPASGAEPITRPRS